MFSGITRQNVLNINELFRTVCVVGASSDRLRAAFLNDRQPITGLLLGRLFNSIFFDGFNPRTNQPLFIYKYTAINLFSNICNNETPYGQWVSYQLASTNN